MVEATDVKFGTWIEYMSNLLADDKLPPKGAWPSSETILEFWDPVPISGTSEARNLKFGMWLDMHAGDKLPPKNAGRG